MLLTSSPIGAHRKLDAAVEAAYGDEEQIVSRLFKLYAKEVGKGT